MNNSRLNITADEIFKESNTLSQMYYSGSSYNSLPSPPYSEENYNGVDEKEVNDNVPYRLDLRGFFPKKKNLNKNLSGSSKSPKSKQSKENIFSKNVPTHLAKVYPNLMKGVMGDKADVKPAKRLKKSPQKRKELKEKIECAVCSKHVPSADLKRHLYFGAVKCLDCGWTEEFCPNFSSFNITPKIKIGCQHHNLKWRSSPLQFLKTALGCDVEVTNSIFKKKLKTYLEPLQPLERLRPWSKAFQVCNNFLGKSATLEPVVNLQTSQVSPKPLPTPNQAEKEIETIDLPDGEFYLILRESIEDCPNCYRSLPPKDLVFNIETWLITIICQGCSLKIYFVLPPPDGSEPKIKILQS